MAGSGDRWQKQADPVATRTVNAVLVVLGSAAVGLISWLCYHDAGDPISLAGEDLLLRQAAALLLLGATFWGFGLWQQIFQDPELDALLVTPLRESEIFWRLWRRQVKWLLAAGAAFCFPAWAWLIGRAGAADVEVAVWMLLAAPVLIEAWLIASAALGALLAPLGPLAPGLAMLSMPLVMPAMPGPDGLLGALARPWHGEAWRAATGWHPAAAALAAAVLISVVLLAATHVVVCFTYTRERLIARRTRHHAPSALRRLLARGGSPRAGRRSEGAFETGLFRRWLDPRTRALWQLCRGDEAPQAFVRHLPRIVLVVLVLAGLMHLLGPPVGERQAEARLFAVGTFVVLGGVMVIFLLQPSLSWYQVRSPERPPQNPSLEPLREVFPVDVRTYMKISLVTGFGIFTLVLLLFMPFFLAGPFTTGGALVLALALWVAGLLLAGQTIPAFVPAIDPRRQQESPVRMLGSLVVATAFFVLVFYTTRWLMDAGYLPLLVELPGWVGDHPWLSLAAGALLLLLYEGLELHWTLRRHRRRWFDASP